MRRATVALIVMVAFSGMALGAESPTATHPRAEGLQVSWGEEVEGWRLGVAICQSKFHVGDPIMVQAATRNVTDMPRRAADYRLAPEMWDIQVSTATSFRELEAMPYTREGQRIHGLDPARPGGGSVSILRLEPGESVSDIVWVNRVRDMTLQGKYTVRIGRRLLTESGEWVTVEAPPFEMEVKWTEYPDSALPQVLVLQAYPVHWEQAAVAFGSYVRELANDLARFAQEEMPADRRQMARTELGKLRAHVDSLAPEERVRAGHSEQPEGMPEEARRAIEEAERREEAARKGVLEAEKKKVEEKGQAQPEVGPAPEPPAPAAAEEGK